MTSTIDTVEGIEIMPGGKDGCTESEARELIQRAATAAVQFEDAIREILRRRAWEPLGYATPQDLILGEFKDGGLQNPRTGKPYGRAHIYRMARTALFLYEVAARTGVDPGELDIAEKALRAAHANGIDDAAMLKQIEQGVSDASTDGPADPDTVQTIIDKVVDTASGRLVSDPDPAPTTLDPPDDAAQTVAPAADDAAPPAVGERTPASPTPTPPGRQGGDPEPEDTSDWPNKDPHPERNTDPAEDGDGDGDSADPYGAFTGQKSGSMAPSGGTTWNDALASANAFIDFTEKLRTIKKLGDLLPSLQDVEGKLPEFLDACDDSELTNFSEALDDVDLILRDLPAFRSAVRAIQECAQDRAEEA